MPNLNKENSNKEIEEKFVKEFEILYTPSNHPVFRKRFTKNGRGYNFEVVGEIEIELFKNFICDFLAQELTNQKEKILKVVEEAVDALESMYDQYCADGHMFMSAGERASYVLRKYGFKFDGGGRIKKRPNNLTQALEEIKKIT